MKSVDGLHRDKVAILYALRHESRARYSELLRETDSESDTFKFHIRKLAKVGYVRKADDGLYELTAVGKEFANRLDEQTGHELVQPKTSMLLVLEAHRDSMPVYLVHQRLREPFYGYWGIASGPVPRGVPVQTAAAHEITKQTGIESQPVHRGILRVTDIDDQGELLEDKFFHIMHVQLDNQLQAHEWQSGRSEWLTREELLHKSPLFPSTEQTFEMLASTAMYNEVVCRYTDKEY